jgi:hypothetical protein
LIDQNLSPFSEEIRAPAMTVNPYQSPRSDASIPSDAKSGKGSAIQSQTTLRSWTLDEIEPQVCELAAMHLGLPRAEVAPHHRIIEGRATSGNGLAIGTTPSSTALPKQGVRIRRMANQPVSVASVVEVG